MMTEEHSISEGERLWLPENQHTPDGKKELSQKEREKHKNLLTHMFLSGQITDRFFVEKNDKKQFEPPKLSTSIRKIFPIVTLEDNDEIYIYNEEKGIYEPNGEKKLREIVKQVLRNEYREPRAKAVIDDITASTYLEREDFAIPDYLVPVENGFLDLRYNPPKLLPHSPNNYITSVMPVKYDPKAKCPNFLIFLEEILPDLPDRLKIQEGFGNCLTPSHDYMIIFFLYGQGANGKSTLLNVLTIFLGNENISNASLGQLAYGKWYMAELYRKNANIYGDIGIKALKHTGSIKILTGEDWAQAEKKFKSPFKFKNYAKPWFSGNMMPDIYDDTDAFHRRWIIIIFHQQFLKGAPRTDPQMIQKLSSPEELSGILNWALEGYYRLRKQKTFSCLKPIDERRKQWHELSDSLSVFITNCTKPGNHIPKEDFFLSYHEYCIKKGLPLFSKSLVGRKMKEMGYKDVYPGSSGEQKWSWAGIEVTWEHVVTHNQDGQEGFERQANEDQWRDI